MTNFLFISFHEQAILSAEVFDIINSQFTLLIDNLSTSLVKQFICTVYNVNKSALFVVTCLLYLFTYWVLACILHFIKEIGLTEITTDYLIKYPSDSSWTSLFISLVLYISSSFLIFFLIKNIISSVPIEELIEINLKQYLYNITIYTIIATAFIYIPCFIKVQNDSINNAVGDPEISIPIPNGIKEAIFLGFILPAVIGTVMCIMIAISTYVYIGTVEVDLINGYVGRFIIDKLDPNATYLKALFAQDFCSSRIIMSPTMGGYDAVFFTIEGGYWSQSPKDYWLHMTSPEVNYGGYGVTYYDVPKIIQFYVAPLASVWEGLIISDNIVVVTGPLNDLSYMTPSDISLFGGEARMPLYQIPAWNNPLWRLAW